MTCNHLIIITKSYKKDKKLMAIFENCNTSKTKIIHFGSSGYDDYTTHKDDKRKQRYLARHRKNEDWTNPITAGSLSRWILWNKTYLNASITDYKKRFNL